MATTWDDVLRVWKGAGLPNDEANRLESVLTSAGDYKLDIDDWENCFVMSDGDFGWYASIFYEAVSKVYTNIFSNFVTSCQSRYGFTPESWADAYNTDAVFFRIFADEINAEIKDICDEEGAGEYSIKGPFDVDFDVPAFGMVDPDDPDWGYHTFPDDWDEDAQSGVAGFPYFILNPFAGYVPSEEIIKTREHRLVNNVRKTIYRETSADLVKTADGGNVENGLSAAMEAAEAAANKIPDAPNYKGIHLISVYDSSQRAYKWQPQHKPLILWLGSLQHPYIYKSREDAERDINRLTYDETGENALDEYSRTFFGVPRLAFSELYMLNYMYPIRVVPVEAPGQPVGSEFVYPDDWGFEPNFLFEGDYYELRVLMPDGNMHSYYTAEYEG